MNKGLSGTVGIVVPTLGERPDLLKRCLESIEGQRLSKIVVLVDSSGGALDRSPISDLVDVFLTAPASGLSAAINLGFEMLNGRTWAFTWIGDDDFLAPGGLMALSSALAIAPAAPFAAGACRYVNETGKVFWELKPGPMSALRTRYLTTAYSQPACLIRSSSFLKSGRLDETLKLTMDLDLWLKLLKLGKPVRVQTVCASYSWHNSSLSSSNEVLAIREASKVRRANLGFLRSRVAFLFGLLAYFRAIGSKSFLQHHSQNSL